MKPPHYPIISSVTTLMSFKLCLSTFCNEGTHSLLCIYFWYMAERFLKVSSILILNLLPYPLKLLIQESPIKHHKINSLIYQAFQYLESYYILLAPFFPRHFPKFILPCSLKPKQFPGKYILNKCGLLTLCYGSTEREEKFFFAFV